MSNTTNHDHLVVKIVPTSQRMADNNRPATCCESLHLAGYNKLDIAEHV